MSTAATRAAVTSCVLVGFANAPLADVFDIKGAEVSKGECEIALNLASQSGFPVHADPVHFSAEASFSYGLTEHWKLGFKSNLDDPVDEDLRVSTVGIENTFAHRGLTTGVGVAWFTGVDVAVHPCSSGLSCSSARTRPR